MSSATVAAEAPTWCAHRLDFHSCISSGERCTRLAMRHRKSWRSRAGFKARLPGNGPLHAGFCPGFSGRAVTSTRKTGTSAPSLRIGSGNFLVYGLAGWRLSITLWLLGFPDQALKRTREAEVAGQRVTDPR
jgi:hypothetical protein